MVGSNALESPDLSRGELKTPATRKPWFHVVVPHLLMVLAQTPMLVVYFSNLWKRPHYQFYPFLVLAVGVLAVQRWPRSVANPFVPSWLGNLLLLVGIASGAVSTVFVYPWFAAVSAVLIIGSLLVRTHNTKSGGSLIAVWLPLLIILHLPFNWDWQLITVLQQISALTTSYLLDMFGFLHSMPGTVLEFPNRSFYVEEACSGVQSFFTLLFCSSIYVVWTSRRWFSALVIVASAIFWSIVMNIIRILTIPVADEVFGIDLSVGWQHDTLGYAVLVFALLMVISTDFLTRFVLGPIVVDIAVPRGRLLHWLIRFWNDIVAGDSSELAFASRRRSNTRRTISLTRPKVFFLWTAVMFITACGLYQITDIQKMISGRKLDRTFFDEDVIVDIDQSALPAQFGDSRCISFENVERSRGSELGQRSDTWVYRSGQFEMIASMDQPFPGWHELAVCYINQGWIQTRRQTYDTSENEDDNWPYVELELKKNTGELGYVLFSFFDRDGQPYGAPKDWNPGTVLLHRFKNRLSYRLRSRLFRAEYYQNQVFVRTVKPLTNEEKEKVRKDFLQLREELRQVFESKA